MPVADAIEPSLAATRHDNRRHDDAINVRVAAPTGDDRPRHATTGRDQTRQDAGHSHSHVATHLDTPRPVAPAAGEDRYVKALERENDFLRGQVDVKDVQIKALTERSRETNALFGRLQTMLQPLLGTGRIDCVAILSCSRQADAQFTAFRDGLGYYPPPRWGENASERGLSGRKHPPHAYFRVSASNMPASLRACRS